MNTTEDYGTVLVFSGRPGFSNDDIEISDLKIVNTRSTASRQVGILGDANRVQMRNFTFYGGPAHIFTEGTPIDRYRLEGWVVSIPLPDHLGYQLPVP